MESFSCQHTVLLQERVPCSHTDLQAALAAFTAKISTSGVWNATSKHRGWTDFESTRNNLTADDLEPPHRLKR